MTLLSNHDDVDREQCHLTLFGLSVCVYFAAAFFKFVIYEGRGSEQGRERIGKYPKKVL